MALHGDGGSSNLQDLPHQVRGASMSSTLERKVPHLMNMGNTWLFAGLCSLVCLQEMSQRDATKAASWF